MSSNHRSVYKDSAAVSPLNGKHVLTLPTENLNNVRWHSKKLTVMFGTVISTFHKDTHVSKIKTFTKKTLSFVNRHTVY
jgi:hypothetical protein